MTGWGTVYVISSGRLCKIGHTYNPVEQRMRMLQAGNPNKLTDALASGGSVVTAPAPLPRYKDHWTDDERQFLVDTHARLAPAEQAQALGRTYYAVIRQRWRLSHSGRIRATESVLLRHRWKPEEDELIRDRIERGHNVPMIAKELRRPVASVTERIAKHLGGMGKLRGGVLAVRTQTEVARLFGVTFHSVSDWIKYGWLTARKNASWRKQAPRRKGPYERHHWLITDDALLTFIHNRLTWPTWKPQWITDPDWRREAQEARDKAGGCWLSVKQIAAQRGVSEVVVRRWYRKYGLPSYQIGCQYYIWSADLEAFLRRRNGFRSGLCTN